MELVWFGILATMLTVYVVLDGFDFGAGIVHRIVAKTDQERRTVLAAIGPVWDGNEVWLIASGGVLLCAFPRAFSVAFSGFYLPLMLVLWLLILRGISIEFRSHHENLLWRQFWDTVFCFASALMALVLGTALGNVIRGVPLGAEGTFSIPLFTNFTPGPNPGVFDWYTLLAGLFTLVVLAAHGALFLAWKTSGPVQSRCRALASRSWILVVGLWIVSTGITGWLQPSIFESLLGRPIAVLPSLLILAGLVGVFFFQKRNHDLGAFLSSCAFLVGVLTGTAVSQYPDLLRSSIDPTMNLTADAAAAGSYSLKVGLVWWSFGIALATAYFVNLFRSLRGKVEVH